jgi:serine/threonine-protein kinase
VALGTITYMSPEQARGEELDARSDLFSFGTLLYEMATGRACFTGNTSAVIFDAILNRSPVPISDLNPQRPRRLAGIILKALEKEPQARYQRASDILADLRILQREIESLLASSGSISVPDFRQKGRSRGSGGAPRIAVLPFQNLSHDPETEYLSEGITESLIDHLAQTPNLRVLSRASVYRYKDKAIDPHIVGRELHVGSLLVGTIMARGDGLTISVELIDVGDSSRKWGETYTVKLSEILGVQDRIAEEITQKLRLSLGGRQKRKAAKRATDNPEAFRLYLKGRFHWNKRTEEGLRRGLAFFQQALDEDPAYARAYAGIADCYAMLGWNSMVSPKEALPKAKAAALRALEIDAELAEAHTSLGIGRLLHDWDWDGAAREFGRSLELNPSYATAHQWNGLLLIAVGRDEEALREAEKAHHLDPLSLSINATATMSFYFAREFERGMEYGRQCLDLNPESAIAHFVVGCTHMGKGDHDQARSEFEAAVDLSNRNPAMVAYLGNSYAMSGDAAGARKLLAELQDRAGRTYVPPYHVAMIHAGLGDDDGVFQWLDRSFDDRSNWVIFLNRSPIFDHLHGEPRFQNLLRRLKLLS